jgi:hypothetical protein
LKKQENEDELVDLSKWKERDWNKEFQDIMIKAKILFTTPSFEAPSSSHSWTDPFAPLSQLADDFTYASKLYAKVIISELHVPVEHKTICPTKIGGIAGGDKYICGGILFKFALDVRGLYGGDEFAMKAASHELKGLQSLFQAGISLDLSFPFVEILTALHLSLPLTWNSPFKTNVCYRLQRISRCRNVGFANLVQDYYLRQRRCWQHRVHH